MSNDVYTPTEYHNILSLGPRAAGWVVKLCMAIFAAAVRMVLPDADPAAGRTELAAEYSLVVLGMLLFSERTWKHHAVTLVLPFAVVCYVLAQPGTMRPSSGRADLAPGRRANCAGRH